MIGIVIILTISSSRPTRSGLVHTVHSNQCHPWSFYNDALQGCQCYNNPASSDLLKCSEKRVLVRLGSCMTNEEGGTFIGYCQTFKIHDQNATVIDGMYIQLPDNISELNDYMCGPMNRKGRECSECIDGFAPFSDFHWV